MGNRIRSFIVFVGLGMLLLTGFDSYGQTLAKHNWYFGNTQRAIRFNRVTNVASLVTNKAVPFGTGGSAVATDRGNGNLLFYTDGQRIYDGNHTLMPNGNGLNGNITANQPVAICPVPGQKGKYFVFTNTANFTTGGSISYSIVDMNLFGASAFPAPAFGDVESKNNAIPTLTGLSEGMITLPHQNGNDFWLITQPVNSQTFNATLINAASYGGVFNTVTSTITGIPPTTISAAHFAYHEGLAKLAVAPQDASSNALILNFIEGTGAIQFDRPILNSAVTSTAPQAIYDIEFSASGRYLYLSRFGEDGPPTAIAADVLQYDYQNTTTTLASVLPAPVYRSYGLQRGPDSLIYHLYQSSAAGSFLLGRIEHPDSVAGKAAYNPAPGPFATLNFDSKQFPGFVPKDTVTLDLDFTVAGTCQNSPTTFFPFVRPGADSLVWNFGDGNFASAWSPIYTYANAGSFNVTMLAYYQGQIDSVSKPVMIRTFSLQVQLVQDTTACKEEFPPPRGSSSPKQFSVPVHVTGGTASSIVWSNGDTGPNLTPDSAGYYYVVVTDAGGCSAYAGVNVREYGLEQTTYNKWYFGNKAGIDFTTGKALNESAMDAPEGVAIACDRNGQQIFYTDGSTVWDKTHAVIATDIGGSTASTQSSLIVPVPGDETLYYIFTTQAINGSDSLQLMYSMFDIKANAGKGAIVKQNVLLFMKSGEQVTANGQWLIVHELGNSTFRSYPVGATGIGNPVYTEAGTDHSLSIKENGEGYMKLGPRNLVAVPISEPTVSNHIDLFQLSDSTGHVDKFVNIDLNEPNGQIYGMEFGPSGQKLFASVRYTGGTSAIFEYSIDTATLAGTLVQKIPVAADVGAIQIGPDGQIYVAVNNSGNNTSLGTISAVEDRTQPLLPSSFTLNGFPLAAGTNSWLGLPNFAQINSTPPQGPDLTVIGLCATDSTKFTGSGRDPNIEMYLFSVFQNGSLVAQSTDPQNPEFTVLLPGPGDYQVTLRLTNRCDVPLDLSRNFKITPPPVNPTAGVPLCNTPTIDLDANPPNAPDLTYLWATGETTETLTVSDPGIYEVDITDTLGCVTHGRFLTADSRPIFDLGPDLTICEDNNTPVLNVGNAGMTIAWTIDGAPASTTSRQAVNVDTPGTYTYAVTVTDPITSCFRTEDKVYTINVSPLFNLTKVDPPTCGSATGSVTLHLQPTAPVGGPYSYFISGPGGSKDDIDQPPGDYTLPNLIAGTYSGIVQDQVSGCTTSNAIGISDATYAVSGVPTACEPVTLNVTSAGPLPVTYTATNGTTGVAVTGNSGNTSPFPIAGLTAGDYVIELRDGGGCINTFNQTIAPGTPAPVLITPDLCANTLTGSGAATYVWTANPTTGITGATTGTTINLTPNAGTVTYTVTGTPAAGCPGIDSLVVDVGNVPVPVLAQTNECAETITIDATPPGTFTYRWFTNGTYDPTIGGSTIQAGLPENGNVYRVQIFEPQSGCTKNSADLTASVQGLVDASLSSTPPCDDGQPITLTAHTEAIGASFAWKRDGTAITGVTDSTTQQTAEGRYEVEVSKRSCKATSSLLITRAPLPDGNLPNIAIICDDPENSDPETSQVDLDPGIFIEYDWTKNGVSLVYTDRVYTADSKGDYQVKITDARRCTNIDKTEVLNECLPRIDAPNAFKPGSVVFNPDRKDLTNGDFWVLTRFIEDEQFHVFIFNRWGEMVFSSADRFFKWNGGYNNDISRPLPPGTYAYVVQYVSAFRPSEGVKEKRGGVALIR